MSTLDLTPRLSDPDGLFEALVDAHQGLASEASRRLDARLVLLLANHIGDVEVVKQAIAGAIGGSAEPRQGRCPWPHRAVAPGPWSGRGLAFRFLAA